jgi:hypothetical protein
VEHELFGREREERTGAGIPRRRGAENDWHQRCKCARIGGGRPGYKILYVLALGCGEDWKEESRRRLASIARSGHDAQRAASDPTTAAFVAECRSPASAAHDFSGWTAPVRD